MFDHQQTKESITIDMYMWCDKLFIIPNLGSQFIMQTG